MVASKWLRHYQVAVKILKKNKISLMSFLCIEKELKYAMILTKKSTFVVSDSIWFQMFPRIKKNNAHKFCLITFFCGSQKQR